MKVLVIAVLFCLVTGASSFAPVRSADCSHCWRTNYLSKNSGSHYLPAPLQSNPPDTTDATFKHDVLDSTIPVMVIFWAQWSGPSRRLLPTIVSVAQDFPVSAKAMRLEVDDNPTTPNTYSVSTLPTVIIFKGGKEFRRLTGSPSKADLTKAMQDALKKAKRIHFRK
jgi:thioredoxin 1